MCKKCNRCGREFPLEVIIDGKARNLQRRKYCLACSPFGRHNTKVLVDSEYQIIDIDAKFIPSKCKIHGETEFIRDCKGYRCKKCRSAAVINFRRKRKRKLVEYFGGKCIRCGYNKCVDALQFHHAEGDKQFGISAKTACKNWEAVLKEARKCQLVCANCHAEIHAEEKT
jgi:hypothetical protein